MGKTREFVENHSTGLKIAAGIVFLILFVNLGLKAYSVVSEDLSTFLGPGEIFLNLPHGESEEVSFNLQSNNYLFCEAACSASLKSLATNETVTSYRNVTLKNSNRTFTFSFEAPNQGEEYKFYSLSVQCSNKRKFTCQREERTVKTGALLTINYTLTEEEEQARKEFLSEARPFLESLKQADVNMLKSSKMLEELEKYGDNFNGLSERFEEENSTLMRLEKDARLFRILFEKGEYLQLEDVPLERVRLLSNSSNETVSLLKDYFDTQNKLASQVENFVKEEKYSAMLSVLNNTGEYWLFEATKANRENMDSIISSLNQKPSEDSNILLENFEWSLKEYDAYEDEALTAARDVVDRGFSAINSSMNSTYNVSTANVTFEVYDRVCRDAKSLNITVKGCGNVSTVPVFMNVTIKRVYQPSINVSSDIDPSIEAPEARCCNVNGCGQCPHETKTPVLFLHGHSMNQRNAPEYSLQAFSPIIELLDKEGAVVDAGGITPFSATVDFPAGVWSKAGESIAVRGTYYFDAYLKGDSYVLSAEKSENIDTYAVRMKELVDALKHRTGSGKVTIVAHSMGGLVARRYAQIFGSDSLEEIIMVATPNNGITERIQTMCPFLGSDRECEDMAQGSAFLSKLNDPSRKTTVDKTMIAGTGCTTGGDPSDGVVKLENAKLEGAENIVVKGNCTAFNPLHTDLLIPEKYPQVYQTIKQRIK